MTQPKSILVVGVGRVGRIIAEDLAGDPSIAVSVADVSPDRLAQVRGIPEERKRTLSLGEAGLAPEFVDDFEHFLLAVPGSFGTKLVEQLVEKGRKVIDISFFAGDPRSYHQRATETGAVVWYDCGVAPGLSNVLAAAGVAHCQSPERVKVFVGGLPVERTLPLQYKAPFSPSDVLEEYTRPARIMRRGKVVDWL